MNDWTIITRTSDGINAYAFARGRYQEELLAGREAWSGSTLQGKARSYKPRYMDSRDALLQRLENAGIEHHRVRIGQRHVLVLGPLSGLDVDHTTDAW